MPLLVLLVKLGRRMTMTKGAPWIPHGLPEPGAFLSRALEHTGTSGTAFPSLFLRPFFESSQSTLLPGVLKLCAHPSLQARVAGRTGGIVSSGILSTRVHCSPSGIVARHSLICFNDVQYCGHLGFGRTGSASL